MAFRRCLRCGGWKSEGVHGMNKCPLEPRSSQESFYSPPDSRKFAYEVMAQHVDPSARGITTKAKYQRLLKSRGLTDDVTTRELKTLTVDTGKRDRVREQAIHRFVNGLGPDLHRKLASGRR